MLPAVDPEGHVTGRLAVLYAGALLPITAALSFIGVTGTIFLVVSQALGFAFIALGWRFVTRRSDGSARRLFLASIAYLRLLLALMMTDRDDRLSHPGHQAGAQAAAVAQLQASDTIDHRAVP